MKRVKHDPLVYYALRDGLVKIGTTTLLAQRMSRLDIDRILAIEPGSEVVEARRHAQFAGLRVYREWFHAGEDLITHTDVLRRLYGLPDFTKRTARGEPILTLEQRTVLAMLPPLVIPVPPGTLERFAAKIRLDDDGPCRFRWLYSDKLTGYGGFTLGRKMGAHKASHLMFVGPVPKGWHVDHVKDRGCVNRDCVWWEHLEAVTPGDNIRRGDAAKPWACCKRGHELTPDNVYLYGPGKNERRCKTCKDEADRARNRRLHPDPWRPKTHCPYGHPLAGENLYVQPSNGARVCRTCVRDRARHRYQRLHGLELT